MRACASGKAELAIILYHWNSTALHVTNKAGKTCAEFAGESSCPSLKEELEELDRQKRKEALETTMPNVKHRGFLKPRQPTVDGHTKERAMSEDASLRNTSLRKPTPASTASRHNRASSSSSSSAAANFVKWAEWGKWTKWAKLAKRTTICLSLYVRPSLHQLVRPSICPSVRLPICPSIHTSLCPSIRLSVRPSVCRSVGHKRVEIMKKCLF